MIKDAARYLLRHPFIRFGLVGTAGYVVDTTVLALDTHYLGLDPYKGRALSIFVAMFVTWLGNRYLTFAARRARGSVQAVAQEWLKFVGANIVGAAVNYTVFAILVCFATPPFDNKYFAQACGVLAGLVFNFSLSKTLVFRNGGAMKL